jgi:MoaA/NifB/PqqE/SkfB family radical SAM enzyme
MKKLDAMPARHPVNATLELTLRCNLKCKMCMFRHSDRENACLAAEELTSAQWADMAQQLFDAGTLNILITGGEPLLRKDFCEIYSSIYRLGFLVTLYTNATLVTQEILQTLRKYPPHRIGITLYGGYLLHRVTQLKNGMLQTTGDYNCYRDEYVAVQCVVGRVVRFIRKGKCVSCNNPAYRFGSWIWRVLFPVRPLLLRFLFLFRRRAL